MSRRRSSKRRRQRCIAKAVIRVFLLVLLCLVFFACFQLKSVTTKGNVHETADDIVALAQTRPIAQNTLLCILFNHNRTIRQHGFVESINAVYVNRNQVRITVTEKKITGYVESGGKFWYIDSSGTVEASLAKTKKGDGIPPVTGLHLHTEPELGSVLPVSRTRSFVLLDSLKTLTDLYGIAPDEVRFTDDGNMSLIYGSVTVMTGDGTNLADRMEELAGILKVMDTSVAGTLHLENYDASSNHIIFDKE